MSKDKFTLKDKIGFIVVDILTNGNYINGFDAVEIADKVSEKVMKLIKRNYK